jgi:DNA polymerase-4
MASAQQVGRKLLARAASRLRRAELRTGGLAVWLRFQDAPSREAVRLFDLTGDTFRLLRAFEECWAEFSSAMARGAPRPIHVGVTLLRLTETAALTPDLFGWTPAAQEDSKRLRLSAALDSLNQRYGREMVSIGTVPSGVSRYMGAKIAFNRVPAAADFHG